MHNLVPVVLGQELSIPLEESIDAVADRAGREIECFLGAEAELDRVFDTLEQPDGLRTTAGHWRGDVAVGGCAAMSTGDEVRQGIWR